MSDEILDQVTTRQLLAHLEPEPQLVLILSFGLARPTDWPWPEAAWPPTYAAIGAYVGNLYRGRPLSEAAIRYIRNAALRRLALIHGPDR